MFVILDGSIDFSDLIKGKSSVEDGFEVKGVEFDGAVVVLYCFLEVLLLAGLPSIGMKDVGLLQSILTGDVMLRETSIIEGAIFISSD